MNYCIKQSIYTADELNKLDFPSLTTKVRDKTFTDEHWQDIQKLSKYDQDFNLYLNVLYYTGCRPSEILNITKSDIEENGIIKIYQNKVKKYKYVSIPQNILKRVLQEFQEKSNEYLFKGHGRQIEYYGKKFRKIRLELNLNLEYSLYTFRHTFATNLLNKTSDIHLVSKALGHSNIMITSKHYANRSNKDIQDRISSLWE